MSTAIPSMEDRDGKIWMDGEMVDWRDAKIHVLTHTLHYGMGVFEGVRAYDAVGGTAIFRLAEHTRRFFNSAKIFQMALPFDEATLAQAQQELTNALRDIVAGAQERGWVRADADPGVLAVLLQALPLGRVVDDFAAVARDFPRTDVPDGTGSGSTHSG